MSGSAQQRSIGGSRLRRSVVLPAAVAVVAGMLAGPATVAVAASHSRGGFATVSRSPRVPAGAHMIGVADTSREISGAVALKPRNPQALLRAATAVSAPRSSSYRHYIAKDAFAAKYGASSATISAVASVLKSSHLSVVNVARNHLLVRFRGTIGSAESAFRTHIANYRLGNGRTGRETTTAVHFPASVASQVQGVVGLNTLLQQTSSYEHGNHPATVKAKAPLHPLASIPGAPHPCAAATSDAESFGGLTDDQLANTYGATGLYRAGDTGVGQRIGVYEQEPFSMADLQAFDKCYFPSTYQAMLARTHLKPIDGGAGLGQGEGEAILDIDDVEGVAPGASFDVYEAPNSGTGSLDMYEQMINDDADSVLTTSWGLCERDESLSDPGYINIENELFQQAAVQGQTVFSSSGDAGSDSCAYFNSTPVPPELSTGDPDSQPFVTGVGGTTTSDAAVSPTQRVWNDGNTLGASGGGVSSLWGAPAWQVAVDNADRSAVSHAVADGLQQCAEAASGGLCRQDPDVSAQADQFTGAITTYAVEFGGWTTAGGTSSAAPLWAAMTALVNASAPCAASIQPHHGVGFVSPALYAVAAVPSEYAASFNDVTAGDNDQYNLTDGKDYAAHAGYDMTTGLGTPNLTHANGSAGLAANLCSLGGAASRPTIATVTPAVTPVSPTGSAIAITGTGFTAATGVSIGGFNVPATDLSIPSSTEIDVRPIPTGAQVGTGGAGPQDGSGRQLVTVTGSNGQSSLPTASTSVLYVDTNGGSNVPSVSGVGPYGTSTAAAGATVTIYGSDFKTDGAVTVTIGGMPATAPDVLSDTQLKVTVPAFGGGTDCAAGDDTTNDVCQAQVVVSNPNGASKTAAILPPLAGAVFVTAPGGNPVPQCVTADTCEYRPATTEFDYFVPPHIDTVGPKFVSEDPGHATIATITGSGFDSLGLEGINIGPAVDADSAVFNILTDTPTQLQFEVTGHVPTTLPVTSKLSVVTLAGRSPNSAIVYAGVPKVSSVSPHAGVDTGGTAFTLTGKGFDGIDAADGGAIAYVYPNSGTTEVQLSGYHANAAGTSVTGTTPQNNPGELIVEACTITACSEPPFSEAGFNASLFDFFDTGDPVVTSLSARSGPAAGGKKVVIHGQDLSDVVSVRFGNAKAQAMNREEFLSNGSNSEIDAVVPPGRAGSIVDVVVTTVESIHGGHSSVPSPADHFSYVASVPAPPRHVKVKAHGQSPTVHWSAPIRNGGSKIRRYRITAHAMKNSTKKGAKAPKNRVVTTASGKARRATLHDLKAGWFYVFKVQAVNHKGPGRVGTDGEVHLISQPAR